MALIHRHLERLALDDTGKEAPGKSVSGKDKES